ncbi:hypothetical protein M430DRAFT_41672 [Amorphotheca resinae ATCC 22711]|uniref:CCHC-type domain-containing protein n=1 Tax=Amorphotheca resinae ATCC 22711 TaxID=857342 RepID=A0A2T3B3Y6_AMORE|nr:hypothetical protein M430DRAFT_41672 [Amorphotheca resinae ATCC 22711]PSS20355.1 hypothetical protein M430DRAFT_41672 [Amorphotheca resinae ATCC 22711]
MDSIQDETEDSRTSEVGRKRDRDAFQTTLLQDPSSDHSDDDFAQRSHKRFKQDHAQSGSESVEDGIIINTTSPILTDPHPAETSQTLPTQHQTISPPPPVMTWNKGVQSGLRTSFGSRSQAQARGPAPTRGEGGEAVRGSETNHQGEDIADALELFSKGGSNFDSPEEKTVDALESTSASGRISNLGDTNPSASLSSSATEDPKPKSKRNHKKKTPSDADEVEEAKGKNSSKTAVSKGTSVPKAPAPKVPGPNLPRILPLAMERVYKNGKGEFDLREILRDGKPIGIEELSLAEFVSHFLTTNAEKLNGLTGKHVKGAFNAYIGLYYGHLKTQLLDKARAHAATESAREFCAGSLAQAKKDLQKQGKIGENETSNTKLPIANSHQKGEGIGPKEVEEAALPGSEREDGEMLSPANEDKDDGPSDLEHELERELLQKYFPSRAGSATAPRCLSCASSGHKTYDCPALTCNICGGGHSKFTCPENQRCGKCRLKGHQTAECPEKLFATKAETGGCEICQSQDHLETACHFIWRSFAPRPEEIRTVRYIPIYCYVCGANGHYGPECGLHRGKILSGGVTWSKSNLQKYLDPASNDRAIAAGTDYSLPSLPRKGFSIKGIANDPITLDDSDDDPNFIRPKVNRPSTNSQRGGTIRFAPNSMVNQVPSTEPSYQRPSNPPRQARPQFGGYAESARYGRERTFSPPPRYPLRSEFPEDDRYRPRAPTREEFRPPSEAQYGRRAMPVDNGFQGGQSGRGRGTAVRGGSHNRGKKRTRSSKQDRRAGR